VADQPAQEKTEKATARKLQKAREEGQVARSMELNSVFIISLGFVTIYLFGPVLFNNIGQMMKHILAEAPGMIISPGTVHQLFGYNILTFASIVGPILLLLGVFAYAINVTQVGFLFSIKSLEPKLDKFNIPKGFKRLLSKRSFVELFRDVIKTILIAIVAYYTISGWMPEIMELADKTAGQYASTLGKLALILAIKISAVLFIVALFDFAFQRYDYAVNQRMTKQEVKEEMKDTDGNPVLKGRIRQTQREMARQRMMSEIPKADVVVTNPTFIAVALRYDPAEMPAPMVVAKGQRLLAQKIREIADEHDIPIVENRLLARSLFKLADVGQYVPSNLYRAVAEVLAYIYRLRNKEGVGSA
jgi:flagellar biosynthetic protein FlhB